ncbi:RNase H domain-containing protein [Trichonephila clavipes]|nr:RNase H domain-containing protein [Trichonephila clavipes]
MGGAPKNINRAPIERSFHSSYRSILEYGVPVYCSASVTNLQKLEKVQLSAARIITGLKNTCPRDIVLFETDLQILSHRRRTCLTKYYNKLRSLDSRNRTSAYFKDWCNNQRLRRNKLPVRVNKQADLPAYLKQLAAERIGDIPIEAVQVYTDGSRDDYYRSGSGIYIKSQDHILRSPDGCSVIRSELIAIDLFQMEKRFVDSV